MKSLCIDFGTVWSKAVVFDSEENKIHRISFKGDNNTGFLLNNREHACPTSVYIEPGDNSDIYIGKNAIALRNKNPDNFYYNFKPYLSSDNQNVPRQNGKYVWSDFVAIFLSYIYELAKQNHNEFDNVIITVPSSTKENDNRWKVMTEACRKAEIKNFEFLREPEAASWCALKKLQGTGKVSNNDYILIYDLGGGTFDLALTKVKNSTLKTIGEFDSRFGSNETERIGGIYFDALIKKYIHENAPSIEKYLDFYDNIPLDTVTGRKIIDYQDNVLFRKYRKSILEIDKIKQEAINSKHSVCNSNVPYSLHHIEDDLEFTRETLEELIETKIDNSIELCDGLLKKYELDWKDIAFFVLVGGSSKIPLIKKKLTTKLKNNNVENAVERIMGFDDTDDFIYAVSIGGAYYPSLQPTSCERVAFGVESLQISDIENAKMQFEKASSPLGCFWLGFLEYKSMRFRSAVEWFKNSTDCWFSLFMLSYLYFLGKGVRKDDEMARKYLGRISKGKKNIKVNLLEKAINNECTNNELKSIYMDDFIGYEYMIEITNKLFCNSNGSLAHFARTNILKNVLTLFKDIG